MGNDAEIKAQIHEIVEQLKSKQLEQLWKYLKDLQGEAGQVSYSLTTPEDEETAHFAESQVIYRPSTQLLEVKPAEPMVADMTVEELEWMFEDAIDRALDLLGIDPDEGLELREEFVEELERAQKEIEAGEVYTFEEVAKELGFDL